MADVNIRPSKDGPYIVEGRVELFDTDGNRIMVAKPRLAPCRGCGSSNKPFCAALIAASVSDCGNGQAGECGVTVQAPAKYCFPEMEATRQTLFLSWPARDADAILLRSCEKSI